MYDLKAGTKPDFAKEGGAWKWKILWCHFDDVI